MKKMKRVVLVVLDGVGAGWQHDAKRYGDEGADTLGHVFVEAHPNIPNMTELGLLKTIGMHPYGEDDPIGCYGTMTECAAGKDTTIRSLGNRGTDLEGALPDVPERLPAGTDRSVRA